jgi:hypothetical protein
MPDVHPQFVFDEHQCPQSVLLPMTEWRQIVEELEELDDIRAYDEAKQGPQEALDFQDAVREIDEEQSA